MLVVVVAAAVMAAILATLNSSAEEAVHPVRVEVPVEVRQEKK